MTALANHCQGGVLSWRLVQWLEQPNIYLSSYCMILCVRSSFGLAYLKMKPVFAQMY